MAVNIGKNTMIADTAVMIGDVRVEDGVSIFDGAVLRGDLNSITVGENSNVQDNVTIHVEADHPTVIGKNVSIGHNAVVHGAVVEDNVIIGMGAIILNGAYIRTGTVVAAGAVVTENFESEENSLIAGVPGKIRKKDDAMMEYAVRNGTSYQKLRDLYLSGRFTKVYGSQLKNKKS